MPGGAPRVGPPLIHLGTPAGVRGGVEEPPVKPGGRETPEVVPGMQQVPWGGPAVLQETFTSSTGMTCSSCSEAGAPANEAAVQRCMGAKSRPGGRQPPLPSTCSHQAKKPPAYGAEAEEGKLWPEDRGVVLQELDEGWQRPWAPGCRGPRQCTARWGNVGVLAGGVGGCRPRSHQALPVPPRVT